jgi:hypothetical protein
MYGYDLETKQHSSQWKSPNSPGPKKQVKFVALVFWGDIQGIVHKEFLPPGQTIDGKFYCEVLKQLREGIQRKRPDEW